MGDRDRRRETQRQHLTDRRVRQLIANYAMGEEPDEVLETLLLLQPHVDTALAHLLMRAHPGLSRSDAAIIAGAEILARTAAAVQTIQEPRGVSAGLVEEAIGVELTNALAVAATDAVETELRAVGSIAMRSDAKAATLSALESGKVSTMTVVHIVLGHGAPLAPVLDIREPLGTQRASIADDVAALSQGTVRELVEAHGRKLAVLGQLGPRDRWRVMLKRWERGRNAHPAHVGDGFLWDRDVARLCGVKKVASLRPRTSAAVKLVVDAYMLGEGEVPPLPSTVPSLKTSPWVARLRGGPQVLWAGEGDDR